MNDVVMVVYSYNVKPKTSTISDVWIYGVYKDKDEGFQVMETMQDSKEYGHLCWGNHIIKVK